MTDLKTLKDFRCITCGFNNLICEDMDISSKELRQEAIKWVKQYENEDQFMLSKFAQFFNLTEEDLACGETE